MQINSGDHWSDMVTSQRSEQEVTCFQSRIWQKRSSLLDVFQTVFIFEAFTLKHLQEVLKFTGTRKQESDQIYSAEMWIHLFCLHSSWSLNIWGLFPGTQSVYFSLNVEQRSLKSVSASSSSFGKMFQPDESFNESDQNHICGIIRLFTRTPARWNEPLGKQDFCWKLERRLFVCREKVSTQTRTEQRQPAGVPTISFLSAESPAAPLLTVCVKKNSFVVFTHTVLTHFFSNVVRIKS